ncbi:hypothetical protein B9Z55_007613 [Caenorhabditis nigoni]|uniref:Uncharacterized protein n=1 Tax=Caenorhabditis nigoni TaxID=1611254 RepID=A0A2G5VAJ8_9PELO|nr:hypothetical protein B9Z55_007613 [Caenorhabditis nigoni]
MNIGVLQMTTKLSSQQKWPLPPLVHLLGSRLSFPQPKRQMLLLHPTLAILQQGRKRHDRREDSRRGDRYREDHRRGDSYRVEESRRSQKSNGPTRSQEFHRDRSSDHYDQDSRTKSLESERDEYSGLDTNDRYDHHSQRSTMQNEKEKGAVGESHEESAAQVEQQDDERLALVPHIWKA